MNQNIRLRALLWLTCCFLAMPAVSPAQSLQDRLYDAFEIDAVGFMEARQGWRLQDDPNQKQTSVSEIRGQAELSKSFEHAVFQLKGDLVGDLVDEEARGELRVLSVSLTPLDWMDLKLGRQTLTWGTGDLLFINDLFPKDWESFFIGRDDEYLKAPSDAVKVSLFSEIANVNLVYSPIFNPSQYIDGSRISYWNPMLGQTTGQNFIFDDHERSRFFNEAEYAIRIYRNIQSIEAALYGYHGYWKTPEGMDPVGMKLFYPELSAYGASLRSPVWGGIGHLEAGYYDSREDGGGDDPFVRNSEIRFLAGFERELAMDFTGGLQYYLEWMSDYDAYEQSMQGGKLKDEFRHVITLRLTKLLMNQTLRLSLFAYVSPSDEDAYLRPKVHYQWSDSLAVEIGGNIFLGSDDHTFFGQFQDCTNAFAGVRWSF